MTPTLCPAATGPPGRHQHDTRINDATGRWGEDAATQATTITEIHATLSDHP